MKTKNRTQSTNLTDSQSDLKKLLKNEKQHPFKSVFARAMMGIGCSIMLGFILSNAGCKRHEKAVSQAPPVIKTATVGTSGDRTAFITAGVLRARNRASLSFQVPGRVVKMHVDMGDWLAAGAELAALDSSAYELRVKQAEADLQTSRANLAERQRRFTAYQLMLPKGAVSRSEFEQIEAGLTAAKSQMEVDEAALRLAIRDLENTVLKAPCAGRVAQRHIQNFCEIAVGIPVIEFDGDGELEILAHVPEIFARTLKIGSQAQIALQGEDRLSLDSSISQISSRSEAGSSVSVILKLNQAVTDLRSGMAVDVSFKRNQDDNVLVLPTVALMAGPESNSASVFVYDSANGLVNQRQVTLGEPSGEGMIVISGLQAGEEVAVAGVSFLRDKQKVRIFESQRASTSTLPIAYHQH